MEKFYLQQVLFPLKMQHVACFETCTNDQIVPQSIAVPPSFFGINNNTWLRFFIIDTFLLDYLLKQFDVSFITPNKGNTPLAPSLADHFFYCGHQLSAHCCVLPLNNGHLRPMPHPCIYFLVWLNSLAWTKEPTAAVVLMPPTCSRFIEKNAWLGKFMECIWRQQSFPAQRSAVPSSFSDPPSYLLY